MNGYLIETKSLNVYEQMAFDEHLANILARDTEQFFLRFYNWTPGPAMTFGYAQFWSEIEKEMARNNYSAPAVRRPTGGGVVYHEGDLTFSCIFTSEMRRAQDIYDALHGAINKFLGAGLAADADKSLYSPSQHGLAANCFEAPVKSDIVTADGKKILGGAIRRFDNVILYQGSLQRVSARTDAGLKTAVVDALSAQWNICLAPFTPDEDFMSSVSKSARDRYQTQEWNRKF